VGSNFIFGYLPYYSLLYTLCNGRKQLANESKWWEKVKELKWKQQR
jgi:hypothetical protein